MLWIFFSEKSNLIYYKKKWTYNSMTPDDYTRGKKKSISRSVDNVMMLLRLPLLIPSHHDPSHHEEPIIIWKEDAR